MPRWCVYDVIRDRFLVNIRNPSCISGLETVTTTETTTEKQSMLQAILLPISATGPHGLDIDQVSDQTFVACDDGTVVALDLRNSGHEIGSVSIAGAPDVVWYNSSKHRLYCGIADPGVIDIIDTRNMIVIEEVDTEKGAHTLTFDNHRQLLYAFLPNSCRVVVYEEENRSDDFL